MEKKIIGYKLKEGIAPYHSSKRELLKAIARIGLIHTQVEDPNEEQILLDVFQNKDVKRHFEAAGVLDLWFEPVYEESSKELYFGKVKFTIKKGDNFATTEYGKVTKEDIEDAISWIENPPKLAGNTLSIHYNSTYCKITELDNNGTLSYGFGCQEGSLKELKTIYNAFK